MSRKVQIVNLEAAESERDVVVTTHDGQTHTIRPGRSLDIETGDVIGVSHRSMAREPNPTVDLMTVMGIVERFTEEQRDAMAQNLGFQSAAELEEFRKNEWTEEEIAAMKAANPDGKPPLELNKIGEAEINPPAPETDGEDQQLSAEETANFEDERPFEDGESQKPVEPGPENPVDPVEEPVTTAENMIGVAPAPTEPEAQA